ncbi:MAG: TylF/MycF/NovP-related O-methyltransferase [Methylocella sp.]
MNKYIENLNYLILAHRLRSYSFCNYPKLLSLMRLAQYVKTSGIDGDFVECGVYRGGTATLLSRFLGDSKQLWLYDSFEGMPDTNVKDGETAKAYIGKGAVELEDVENIMRLLGKNLNQVLIKKGWFSDTFIESGPKSIALLHCDADWYESVLSVLNRFYDAVSDGGVIILDDFGYWEGCREAFYEFCKGRDLKPLVERVSSDQLYWIKGKETNR